MDALLKELLTRRARGFLGGALGGLLGTSGMILVGIAAEAGAGLPPGQLIPELELGFGGPLAGAGILGSGFSLPVHFLHGFILGLLYAGLVGWGDSLRLATRLRGWSSGILFGAAVSGFVLLLLRTTTSAQLTIGLLGLVCLLHLTFGALTGSLVQRWQSFSDGGSRVAAPA